MSAINITTVFFLIILLTTHARGVTAFFSFGKSGSDFPKLYEGWFDGQIAKQASSAVAKAYSAGIRKIEVQFPAVPNLEEVRFGTTLNLKFGKDIVAADLKVEGGYKPGSEVSRQLVLFSNVYWAKKIANAINGESIACVTTEPISFGNIKSLGRISRTATTTTAWSRTNQERKKECVICINPGGEEQWDKLFGGLTSSMSSFIVLNNSFSTSYDLGNKHGYEEAFYLKRISKGWIYRVYPGPWEAYLEKPGGTLEKLKSYTTKPSLREVSELVREESFKRFSIYNDRWSQGFGGRL